MQDLWLYASNHRELAWLGRAIPTVDHTSFDHDPDRRPTKGSFVYLVHGTQPPLVRFVQSGGSIRATGSRRRQCWEGPTEWQEEKT